MNKLLNVSRKGGFPWAAETADTLNRNFRYIEAIMDGFNIGYREAIILSDQNNGTPLMYIKDMGWEHGKIVSTTTQILAGSGDDPTRANLLKNLGKYTLIDNSQKISIYKLNSDTEKYEDCILNESYEIVLADSSNPGWMFFEMEDFFERERWVNINLGEITFSQNLKYRTFFPNSRIRYSILRKKLEIQIQMSGIRYLSGDELIMYIPIQYAVKMDFLQNTSFPLLAIEGLPTIGNPKLSNPFKEKNVVAFIYREFSEFAIYLNFESPSLSSYHHDTVHISGSIILEYN